MSLQVTPGFGTTVATQMKGSAHHQDIIAHRDSTRVTAVAAATAASYTTSQVVGGEMIFPAMTRFAGDYAIIKGVSVALCGRLSSITDLTLVIYQSALTTQPLNGSTLVLTAAEVASVQAVVSIGASLFIQVGEHSIANVQMDWSVQAGQGTSALRAVVFSEGRLVLQDADSLSVTISVERN